ncbi:MULTISPECIES: alanine racemase [Metabacillus]|uniref:Alanine racemase n=1 Tax=Metabacillus hrfriensis TaxID=3048891 RepID=A0ACD4RC87_9BACI|nr:MULTISPECIES: alanine racemase [Metabacillus]UAL52545.1 alanine racemase [Metabacillus dongyingensis]USK28855.1 alanine racemase [Bacillus sp. CMF21]WHZ58072.1 alanine racemase [Metabacillus sp. CT-WN-B3]
MGNSFYRDTWAEIDLDAIYSNVKSMKNHIGENTQLIAVVKANAYGHGDAEVAKTALEAGAEMLAVAFLDEAVVLREAGFEVPILVMGASRPADVKIAIDQRIILTAPSLEWLTEAEKNIQKGILSVHLKIDTGMGRLGVRTEDELLQAFKFAEEKPNVKIEGIFTHFATADELDTAYFNKQYDVFAAMAQKAADYDGVMIHCGNSATGLRFPEKLVHAVRLGISMYGLSPSMEIKPELPYELKEAFSLHSRLVHVKKISKGDKVSYGATYTAEKDEWIGTIPIGYADGWVRRLKESEVLIDGERMPIVGRICMDQCMIKLTSFKETGTKVTLIGRQKEECISVDEVAERLETINYEVPCTITLRVPRMFLKNKSIIEVRNSLFCGVKNLTDRP